MEIRVEVESLYTGNVWTFTGTERAVEAALLLKFPFLRSSNPDDRGDLEGLLEHLNSQQAFEATIQPP